MRQSDEEGPAPMSTDLVDELLRADEGELHRDYRLSRHLPSLRRGPREPTRSILPAVPIPLRRSVPASRCHARPVNGPI